jgi:hypothetical protein
MRSKVKSKQPARLSNEDLRKSRLGLLGRFPSEVLYEPEENLQQPEDQGERVKEPRRDVEKKAKPRR